MEKTFTQGEVTAIEYLKDHGWEEQDVGGELLHLCARIEEYAEIYHQNKVKSLSKPTPAEGEVKDGCADCKNNNQGVEAYRWCINNCFKGSKYEAKTS